MYHKVVVNYYRFSKSKKFPDIVLETWRPLTRGKLPRNSEEKYTNVPRVYIELKSTVGDNELQAVQQAKKAVSLQHGKLFPAQDIIIAVRGFIWLFMEYQFGVGTHNTAIGHRTGPNAVRIKLMAYDHRDPNVPATKDRPTRPGTVPIGENANGETGDGYQLDMRNVEDEKHCFCILSWISITKVGREHVRNIALGQGYTLPSEVTASTFRGDLSNYDLAKLGEFKEAKRNEDDELSVHGQGLSEVIALVDILDKEENEKQAVAGASR